MSSCPSSELLEQLLDEELTDANRRAVSAHVNECTACQAALEQLTTKAEVSNVPLSSVQRLSGAEPLAPFLAQLKEASVREKVAVLSSFKESALSGTAESSPAGQKKAVMASTGSGIPVVPGYEILGELGRGGMGVVYKARQVGLKRLVALKMILAGPHAGPKDLARFRQEAEAVARLHHPNIVQIYDIGEANGTAYIALEFVEEGNLVQRLRGDPQPMETTVRLLETLARAVHFAHQRDIVHRDLKPANILLASSPPSVDDEVVHLHPSPLNTLQPKITDFGLAKRLDEQGPEKATVSLAGQAFQPDSAYRQAGKPDRERRDLHGPQSGEIIGTPSYMAPEQALGKPRSVGPAADVYALGAILYEMLTGRPPFKGATPLDTVVQVLYEEPVRPSHLRPRLPRDLETICLKCLAKEPARRYATAAALADDLQRFRKGKPILAHPISFPERSWKWARRRPLPAALLAGMIGCAILGFAGITWQWQEAARARDIALGEERAKEIERQLAETARAEAVEERKRTRTALYYSQIAQSQLRWRLNDVTGAVQSLEKCLPFTGQEDRRGWEWHYLLRLFHSDLFTLSHPHGGEGGNATYHPDGSTIASVVGGRLTDDGSLGEVRIWNATTGATLHILRAPGTVHRLAYRPDGKRLALVTTDGRLFLWDADTGKELFRTAPHAQMITDVAWDPVGRFLASASWDETVKISDAGTGQILRVLPGHSGRVQSVAFDPKGKLLASGGWDATVRIWDPETGNDIQKLTEHQTPVYGVAFSPDGRLLATASSNGNLKIWERDTRSVSLKKDGQSTSSRSRFPRWRVIQSHTARSGAVLGTAFSPDGRYLAYSGGDGTVRVWDIESGIERVTFRGHTAPVESVQFSPDGQRLVSFSPLPGAVKVWDFTRHPEYATFARVRGRVDQTIKVRDLTGRAESSVLSRTGPDIEALAFQAHGSNLVSVAVGGKLQVWDAFSGALKEQQSLPLCEELISPAVLAAFDAEGQRLAGRAREDERLVKVWNVANGQEQVAFRGHTLPVYCIRFSGEGNLLVTCACDIGASPVAPVGQGFQLNENTRQAGKPDLPKRSHEIRVWDAASGKALAQLTGSGLVFSVAFSPDSRWLALGAQDGAVLLADWAGSAKPVRLMGHESHVAAVSFSGDGRLLASAGMADNALKIWDLESFDRAHSSAPPLVQSLSAPVFLCDLAFSPDGRRLAGIARDIVKMWDVGTGQEVLTLRGAPQRHWDPAFNPRIVFSPDGKRLVGTNWDESISMWDTGTQIDEDALAQWQSARRQAANARAVFWHLQEAEDCLEHASRSAATFHFQRLGTAILPKPLEARKERLAAQLGQ
jgi:WD40 repeat protein/serine/threonine protein kinase